jgi:hypothetical protein
VTLPIFPFEQDRYAMTMGTRALAPECLIEVDAARYRAELALKAAILAADERYHYQCPAAPDTTAMAWETVTHLLPAMARRYPGYFALQVDGARWRWTNRLLGQTTDFIPGDTATLPRPPLDWLGRQVQEDLLLLDGTAAGTPLVAGHLCFPAGWCLDEKLGQSFLAIHDPVPGFREQIGRSADLLMQRIKPDHPSIRYGWSLAVTDRLNRAPKVSGDLPRLRAAVTAENAGARLFVRVERQTFSRLPRTRAVLFTIHTYLAPLAAVLTDRDRLERFSGVLRTLPPPLRDYKGITPLADRLLAYLERRRGELAAATG